ncbi:MAG TPA: MerR family transcriptional regulator, partial [Bacillota bacterium]|nr:MerR family transcriptional regulator [Bacillota bacterium]
MEIRNCRRCGKIYQYNGGYICNNCIRQEEEDFQKVKQDVIDNPGATPIEVSDRTGVELKVITRFLREGRLESEDFEIEEGALECENCRRPIKSGRFCERCASILQQEFKKAAQSLETD